VKGETWISPGIANLESEHGGMERLANQMQRQDSPLEMTDEKRRTLLLAIIEQLKRRALAS